MFKKHETSSKNESNILTQAVTIFNELQKAAAISLKELPIKPLIRSIEKSGTKVGRFILLVLKAMYYHRNLQFEPEPMYWWEENKEGFRIIFLKILTPKWILLSNKYKPEIWNTFIVKNGIKINPDLAHRILPIIPSLKSIWSEPKWVTVGILRESSFKGAGEQKVISTAKKFGWSKPPIELAFLIAGRMRKVDDPYSDLKEIYDMDLGKIIVMHEPQEYLDKGEIKKLRLGLDGSFIYPYKINLVMEPDDRVRDTGFAFVVSEE